MLRTALKFIRYDKAKSIGVVIGIVVSTFLIGQQIGILNFLMDLMGGLINNSRTATTQIWVVDSMTKNANNLSQLDKRKVYEIQSIDGVRSAEPMFIGAAVARFKNGKTAPVNIIGSNPPGFVAGPNRKKIFKGTLNDLVEDYGISADYFDAKTFGSSTDVGTELEINGTKAIIRMQTKNARGFGGSYFYTTLDKARMYCKTSDVKISAIAVSIDDGFTPQQVVKNINAAIPGIRAWTTDNLRSTTVKFLVVSSNIGSSIGSLVIFAILSGFFIIGLTLYSSAMDRIRDYGTLKAIGARNRFITKLIITQSALFSITGFIIAIGLLTAFKAAVSGSGLLIHIGPMLMLGLFLVTFGISLGSTFFFSVRTIKTVEPASVFRN
ncbi:ABC transporter permease [Saccharicrinis sp. FJH54]|uniref:ABC transporter permease n=1 Tax=Saccharicrinis sp. FJH54 TaxID=3344665 RepID=UPI0035D43166